MTSREFSLNAAACRLLHNIMPGLETAVVFQEKVSYHTLNQEKGNCLLSRRRQFHIAVDNIGKPREINQEITSASIALNFVFVESQSSLQVSCTLASALQHCDSDKPNRLNAFNSMIKQL